MAVARALLRNEFLTNGDLTPGQVPGSRANIATICEFRSGLVSGAGMTTTAIDKAKKVVASDSRWSVTHGDHVYYVDDTGFEKIVDRPRACLVCAGDGVLIDEWKEWFRRPGFSTDHPRTERLNKHGEHVSITVALIQKPECKVLYSHGLQLEIEDQATFSGSGAFYARDCFIKNRCGKRAIASAAQQDFATGGEVKYVETESCRNNLHDSKVNLAEATNQLLTRGIVVNTKTGKVVPLKEFQSGDGGVVSAIVAGEVSLSAPTGQPYRAWSDSEKQELKRALETIAELERAANN